MVEAVGIHRVVDDERLVVAEVAVGQPVHQPVAERVQLLARAGLRNTEREPTEVAVEGRRRERALVRDADRSGAGPIDRGVPHVEPIDREVHRVPVVVVDLDQRRRSVRGRERSAVDVRREHAAPEVRLDREHVLVDHPSGAAVDQLIALEREDADAGPTVTGLAELVDRDHVRMLRRPDAELRIVVQVRLVRDVLVRAPRAGRVAGLRDRDALVERPVRKRGVRQLARQPAVGELVVEHDRVSAIAGRHAAVGLAREHLVAGDDPRRRGSVLVEDPEREVHPLHVVVGPDVALGVRRIDAVHVVDPFEVGDRRRHQALRSAVLDEGAARVGIGDVQAVGPGVLHDALEGPVRLHGLGPKVAERWSDRRPCDLDGRHVPRTGAGGLRNGRAGCHSPPDRQLRRLFAVSRAEDGEADGDSRNENHAENGEPETRTAR